MFAKTILTAAIAAATLAAPVAAAEISAGHAMQAAILNLDPSDFSRAELAQIAAERDEERRDERAAFILAQRDASPSAANAGHRMLAVTLGLDPAEFTASELGQIAGEEDEAREDERADYIRKYGRADLISSAVASDVDRSQRRGRDDS